MTFENKDYSTLTDPTMEIQEVNEDLDLSMADEEGFEKLDEYDDEDDLFDNANQSSFAMSQPPTPKDSKTQPHPYSELR